MANKKILTDLTIDGQINFDTSDNSIGLNADDKLTVYGDLALRLETADGVVVNLDDTASITGTSALSIGGGNIDMGNITGSKNFAFPNEAGTVALTSQVVMLSGNQTINGDKSFGGDTSTQDLAVGGDLTAEGQVELLDGLLVEGMSELTGDIKTYEGKSLIFDA